MYKQRVGADGAPLAEVERHTLAPATYMPAGNNASAALDSSSGIGSGSHSPDAAAHAEGHAGSKGDSCGSCYGAEDADHPCCSTCDAVRRAVTAPATRPIAAPWHVDAGPFR